MKRLLSVAVLVLLIIFIFISFEDKAKRDPDYIIKQDDFTFNIYFSQKYLSMVLLALSYDNTLFFQDYEIQSYYENNFNRKDINNFIKENHLEKILDFAIHRYKIFPSYSIFLMIMTKIGEDNLNNFINIYKNEISTLRQYFIQKYAKEYFSYTEEILKKYFKYINMKGNLDVAFYYPIIYIPKFLGYNDKEEYYLNNMKFNGLNYFYNSIYAAEHYNNGLCDFNHIFVTGQDKYLFTLVFMHETLHLYQNLSYCKDELAAYFEKDEEIDTMMKELSFIIPDMKDYNELNFNINWFSFLWDTGKGKRFLYSNNKIVYKEFLEAMPYILEFIIIYNENLDKVIAKDFKSIKEYSFFLRLAKIIIDKDIFNEETIKTKGLNYCWYLAFKEYLKLIIENKGIQN
ncbi:MAG: hypothetical protein NUV32_10620 [Exilispira sp.]|nr:hypothetical protein [Exilispira sp.]